ncbi:MAG: hypothetical protein WB440_12130 [Steroidobacteraceae bacterium]
MTFLKSLVLLLALANVGYFLWAHGIASPPAPIGEPVQASTLKLASEAPAASAAMRSGSADAQGAGPDGHAAATDVPAGAPSASPQDAAPGLLSNVKRCVSIGPFRDVAEAARSAATLRGGGYEPRQRVAEGEVWAGVWVYLPVPSTRAAGDQVLAKLRAGGIDDALEMPGPNDRPVISLGLFSEPRRAEARVAQAQSLGLNPGIADRKRTGDVYWIDVDLKPTDSLINPADLQGDSRHILRLQVAGCPAVAPS